MNSGESIDRAQGHERGERCQTDCRLQGDSHIGIVYH
jgi:hypothetical protein